MNEHHHSLPEGYQLFEYRIDGILGTGGFGITYLGWDSNLDKQVAIKEYLPGEYAVRLEGETVAPRSTEDEDDYAWGLERFLDEARALARFDHPNINRVLRFFEANNTAYLVLEYVEGRTLAKVLKSGYSFSEAEITEMLGAMLSGLAVVHRAGYVHRDIKPANIMLRPDGQPVLLDFGAARQAIGRKTQSITTVLTPGYAPIEQYDQHAEDIGPWTDIYALGMVFYRCVTGISDGELVDAVARARMQRKGEDPLAPAVIAAQGKYSPKLLEAIDWAVAVNEEDRPQNVSELTSILPAFENRTQVSGRGDTQAPTQAAGQAPGGRHPADQKTRAVAPVGMTSGARWALGVTLALVLIGIALGAAWVFWAGPPDGGESGGPLAGGPAPGPQATDPTPAVASPVEVAPAYLVVRSNVSGDHVIVDGRDLGHSGTRRHELAPGEHEIRVEKKGYIPWKRTLTLESGKTLTVRARLRPLAGVPPVAGGGRRGHWFAVFRSTDNRQRWVRNSSLQEFTASIQKGWEDNYHLSRVIYSRNTWVGVFVDPAVGCANRNGYEVASTRSEFINRIKERWKDGFTLVDMAYGEGVWFGNFCEDARGNTYATASTWDALAKKISQKWNKDSDWHVISVERGRGGWMAVFVKGLCPGRNGWNRVGSSAELERELRQGSREGFSVRNIRYTDGAWYALRCEDGMHNIYETASSWEEMKKKISTRWSQKLDLVALDYGPN